MKCLDCKKELEVTQLGILPGSWARYNKDHEFLGYVCHDCHESKQASYNGNMSTKEKSPTDKNVITLCSICLQPLVEKRCWRKYDINLQFLGYICTTCFNKEISRKNNAIQTLNKNL